MSFQTYNPKSKECGIKAIDSIKQEVPLICLIISRFLNGNLVVYEVITKHNCIERIDMYWLDLDPAYRKESKSHRVRCELSMLDRKVYGFTVSQKLSPYKWKIFFNKLPNEKLYVTLKNKKAVMTTLDGKEIQYFHINGKKRFSIIPSISSVVIYFKKKQLRAKVIKL